jgi:rod shape-determining protein MreC
MMAPKSSRRPGFSRRAQYSLFASYVIAIIGAVIGLLLIITSRFDPAGHAAIQSFFADVTSPISSGSRAVVRVVRNGFGSISAYFYAASKNKAMEDELKASRQKTIKGQVDAAENRRLKRMLKLVERMPDAVVTARLVNSSSSSSRRYATLTAGSTDGIANGQPVISSEGLVGRIVQTGQITARVLLIVDGGNIIPVKRVTDNVPAVAVGLGDGTLELRPLSTGANPFQVKDVFVTSGSGGIYKPGIPVAIAVSRNRESAIARPLADPNRLDFAAVEPAFAPPPPPPPGAPPQGED